MVTEDDLKKLLLERFKVHQEAFIKTGAPLAFGQLVALKEIAAFLNYAETVKSMVYLIEERDAEMRKWVVP